jgi:glycosyltransferase involved in cell wall biosynthesis
LPKALKKYNVDVFFSPDGYLSLRTEIPQICTIHDINFEHYPKDLPRSASWYLRRYFPRFAEKADHIVTVSEYSKNDLCKTYSIPNTKVTAVWNGASENFKPIGENEVSQIRDKFTNGRPYFVFVGSIHPRKNLKRLIEAFALYSDQNPSAWDLVVVGENMWKGKNKLDIPESILDKVHFTGRLSQEDLAKVVGSAESLAYIPYFEGFGIPLVEAMKCGIPIISGDRTSLPEVAGEAALYCDPFDANSVKQALEKMSNNDEIRNDLKRKSIQRADLFSWDKAADQTWSEIEKILPSHNKAKS